MFLIAELLTTFALMDFSFWFDTINLGCSIVYVDGVTGYPFKSEIVLVSVNIVCVLSNDVDPQEMRISQSFHVQGRKS